MPLIAPGICRFTVNQRYGGREVANIIDMRIDTTGGTTSREEACNDVAGDILNNWVDHIMDLQSDDVFFDSVTYVDLDEADGPVGERTSTSARTLPLTGGITEPTMPGNVSVLVQKQIVGTRGRRNGRMYLVGTRESDTDNPNPNTLAGSRVTAWNAVLASFLAGINDAEGPYLDVQREMVVVHTTNTGTPTNPVIEYVGFSPVESLTVASTLATQRRRLRA